MTGLRLKQKNFIAGQWCDSESQRRFDVRNPADWEEVLHSYPKSTTKDTDRAIESAAQGYRSWKNVPIAERAAIFRRVAELIRAHSVQLAKIITAENGKLLSESYAEIDSTLHEMEFQVGEGLRQFGVA
ncbi:MAG: aldehyde dehydrogenase family protein, partial [Pseudomonadota bacterium]